MMLYFNEGFMAETVLSIFNKNVKKKMLSDLFIYVKSVGKKGFKCIKKRRRKCYKEGKRWLNRRCKMLLWLSTG